MPVIQITTWPIKDDEQARALIEGITRIVHETTAAPLDKISVFISEVQPSRWGDAGVLGSAPEFREKSRRLVYEEAL
ncbi:MAG: tautomerase family protein [Proteobacteria bacterium]|nr:tautomerase family protein [Pseudomonadota bacterium]